MRERVALVDGGDTAIADALRGAGFDVRPLDGDGDVDAEDRADAVVLADLAEPDPRPLVELDDASFEARWEEPMGRAIASLAVARRRLRSGGRVVVVLPACSLSGAAGMAAHAAAVEGRRLLALSAARQWAADGIAVNCVAVTAGDVGPIISFLASEAATGISAATIPVGQVDR